MRNYFNIFLHAPYSLYTIFQDFNHNDLNSVYIPIGFRGIQTMLFYLFFRFFLHSALVIVIVWVYGGFMS